jgi:hypothetical protein
MDMAQQAMSPKTVAEQIGREYVESDSLPAENTPEIRQLYDDIADRVTELFADIPVPVQFQATDPYDGYTDMAETVAEEQKLRVYNQHTEHPYFDHMEQLAFRAVHDWYGHLSADVDFSPEGEYKKYVHMKHHFTWQQNKVMFAEVVGQVGVVHYLPGGFADDRYEQRAFKAPGTWMARMYEAVLE